MARKPAAPRTPDSSAADQLTKFKQTARELGCDEDPAAFDEVLRRLATAPPVHKRAPPRTRKPKTSEG